jgi:phosphate starvation-inducible protein PhoH and related proteins
MRKIAVPEEGIETFFGSYDENLGTSRRCSRCASAPTGTNWSSKASRAARPVERVVGQFAALVREGYRFAKGEVKTPASSWRRTRPRPSRLLPEGQRPTVGKRQVVPKSLNQRATSRPSTSTTSSSASAPPAPGRPTWPWRRPSRACSSNKRVTASSSRGRPSRRARSSASCRATCRRRSTPTCARSTTRCYDMLDAERIERLLERGTIEVAPLAFMRGRTLNDAFVILDEAQNTTSEQMKMFLTRLGFGRRPSSPATSPRSTCRRAKSRARRGPAHRAGGRGHRVRALRRDGRRAPQARAADREGLRGVRRCRGWPPRRRHHTMTSDDPDSRPAPASRMSRSRSRGRAPRLAVAVVDGRGRPAVAPGLARWLGAWPARLGGRGRHRARRRPAHADSERATTAASTPPPTCSRSRPTRPAAPLGDIVIATGVATRQARAGRTLSTPPNCACSRCTGCCTCSATTTIAGRSRPDGQGERRLRAEGRSARGAHRARSGGDDRRWRSSCSAAPPSTWAPCRRPSAR